MKHLTLLPELLVLVGTVICFGQSWLRSQERSWLAPGAAVLLIVAIGFELWVGPATGPLVRGLLLQDRFALALKLTILIATLLLVLLSESELRRPEGAARLGAVLLICGGGMALASSGRFVVAWLSLAVAVLADLLLRGRAEGSIRRSMAALEVGLLVLAGAGLGALYWLTKVASLTQLVGSLAASPRAVPVVICASLSIAAVVGILVIRFSALLADGVGGTRTGAGVLGVGAGAIFLFKFGAAVSPDVRDWGPFVLILGAGILSIAMLRSLVASTPKRQAGDLAIAQLAIALAGGLGAFQLASTAGIYLFGIWMVAAMGVLVTCEVAEVKTWRALAGMGHNGGLAAYRAGALVIGLVSLAGVPPLGGWFGEIDVLSQFGRAGNWWWATLALAAWLLAAFAVVRALGAMLFETPHQEETPLYRPGSRRSGQARRTVAGSPLAWVGTILTLTLPAAYTIASQPIQSLAFQAAEAIGLR